MAAAQKFTVRAFADGDELGILALFNQVFAEPSREPARDRSHWNWEYRDCPGGKQIVVAIDAEGAIIGHYAGIPLRAWVEGQEVMFSLVVDTMVHPLWRGGLRRENLMVAAGKEYFRVYGESSETYASYGFPNQRAIRLGERDLHYRRLFDPLPTLYCNLFDPGQRISVQESGLILAEVDRFAAETDVLWRDLRDRYPLALIRDADYLNWRYVDNPRKFRRYLVRDESSRLRGMAIFCERWMGQPILAIVDYLAAPDDTDCLAAVLERATAVARDNGQMRVEVWLPEKAQQFSDALGLGFCSEPSLFTMGDRQHRVPGRLEWCQENWYYTIGDSDVH